MSRILRVAATIKSQVGNRARDDLLLLFFSGHGITNDENKLYQGARLHPLHHRLSGGVRRWRDSIALDTFALLPSTLSFLPLRAKQTKILFQQIKRRTSSRLCVKLDCDFLVENPIQIQDKAR